MVEQILFVLSGVSVFFLLALLVIALSGKDYDVPIPILHNWGIHFGNTYISTPAVSYQIYFWANYFDIFAV